MTDWTPLPELRKGQGHTRAAVKRRTALRRLALKMLDEIIKAHNTKRRSEWPRPPASAVPAKRARTKSRRVGVVPGGAKFPAPRFEFPARDQIQL
jgi:hypothetical protein